MQLKFPYTEPTTAFTLLSPKVVIYTTDSQLDETSVGSRTLGGNLSKSHTIILKKSSLFDDFSSTHALLTLVN
jgi:hypothetical protein